MTPLTQFYLAKFHFATSSPSRWWTIVNWNDQVEWRASELRCNPRKISRTVREESESELWATREIKYLTNKGGRTVFEEPLPRISSKFLARDSNRVPAWQQPISDQDDSMMSVSYSQLDGSTPVKSVKCFLCPLPVTFGVIVSDRGGSTISHVFRHTRLHLFEGRSSDLHGIVAVTPEKIGSRIVVCLFVVASQFFHSSVQRRKCSRESWSSHVRVVEISKMVNSVEDRTSLC